jgi:hypothetical protein
VGVPVLPRAAERARNLFAKSSGRRRVALQRGHVLLHLAVTHVQKKRLQRDMQSEVAIVSKRTRVHIRACHCAPYLPSFSEIVKK